MLEGARKRYHPLTSAVVKRLAHELEVIERAGLAEFFLICWDLMRFARDQGIPAQGRGSATSSIVSYTLGISRVEPIAHNLLFERFINPGRTTYPDVDIDFSSERREEVIQYIYRRYGPEHTGMVCNLVTYRARSAVREVGYALGFPRPLVDRVAKALETYDSVMVRRDLEADGGFAEFFRRTGEDLPAEARAADQAEAHGLVDGMGQLNTRVPLIGKVPPWRQPVTPEDPDAPRPFASGRGTTSCSSRPWRPDPLTYHPRVRDGDEGFAVRQIPPGLLGEDPEGLGGPSAGSATTGAGIWRSEGPVDDRSAPRTAIRGGGTSGDEGGPGDTPASVAWLRAGRGTGYADDRDRLVPPAPRLGPRGSRPRHAAPGAAQDRPARPAEPVGSARAPARGDGPRRRRASELGRPP